MIIRKTLTSLAVAGMVFGSTAAVAAPAASRTSAPVDEAEGLAPFAIIVGLLIAAGTVAVIASDSDEDPVAPVSP